MYKMNTYYIPVHFYEQEAEDDELIMFVTKKEIAYEQCKNYFTQKKKAYIKKHGNNCDRYEMLDVILDEFAKSMNGLWCYCKTTYKLIIGEPNDFKE